MKNRLLAVYRSINRNKLNSMIKVLGLGMSLIVFLFLIVFVKYEQSYDRHFSESENIYRVIRNWKESETYGPSTPSSLLNELSSNFAEIETGTRIEQIRNKTVICENNVYNEAEIFGVDTSFIETFSLSLLSGNKKTALTEPQTLVISSKKSKIYFGDQNPIGKTLKFEGYPFNANNTLFTITGIFENYPENTHFKPDFLLSLKSFEIYSRKENHNHSLATYVKLHNGSSKSEFEAKLPDFIRSFYGDEYYDFAKSTYKLQPVSDIHLNKMVYPFDYETAKGSSRSLVIFPILGILILIISAINLINLTVSEEMKRLKSFGIRKLLGAGKLFYLRSYMFETLIYLLLALILLLVFVPIILPHFNLLMERELSLKQFFSHELLVLFLITLIVLFLVNGLFPVLSIHNTRVIDLIQEKKKLGKYQVSNYTLSQVFQFGICIFLFIGSIGIYKQMSFINAKTNDGLKTDNVLIVNNAWHLSTSKETFKQKLLTIPTIKSVSICNDIPGTGDFSNWGHPLDSAIENVHVSVFECDHDYMKTLGLELSEGRFFQEGRSSDANSIILNEAAIKRLGWEENPIGKRYRVGKNFTVIGVAKDSHFESLQYEISPQAFIPNRHATSADKLIIKIDTEQMDEALPQILAIWTAFIPNREMLYGFVDQEYKQWYKSEKRISYLSIFLSLVAVFLSSLGLFAAILFQVQNRQKEIGIRKINGAKVSEILSMLNKDFIKWVAVAFVIACPIAYYTMNKWLENFAYKTTLSWWIFALAGVLALGIALVTVSWQSWRAATRNPVEALRYE